MTTRRFYSTIVFMDVVTKSLSLRKPKGKRKGGTDGRLGNMSDLRYISHMSL